jgi:alpha-beta hydrolase superfamily lysophospholipase
MPRARMAAAMTLFTACTWFAAIAAGAEGSHESATPIPTHYHTATVDNVSIFYREAGPADGPVVVLLHGFPTSSHMFRNLIPVLADRYHVIAPDYPGFGQSAMPDHTRFAYTFGHYADLMDGLL